ncbi:MAG TPA: sensor histidine kinase [Candidatus Limnocylindrales bacterium]|nr:sensor histidine kinase [Candidatus Limnocylindrales bacterium]
MSGRLPLSDSVPDESNLRGLKLLAVFLPVTAVIVGEIGRAILIAPSVGTDLDHLISAGLAIAAVLAFTGLMLAGIGRAQRSLIRQNRDLRLATAVSVDLQEDDPLDEVIQRALTTLMDATGAREASVEILADPQTKGVARTIRRATDDAPPVNPTSHLEIPLRSGTALVGQLWIGPADHGATGPVDLGVVELIAHEIASAIQVRQLVVDLRRRRRQSSALYDIALQVTNRQPLADILGSISLHAHDLLEVDEATLCLSESASAALRQAHVLETDPPTGDGLTCFIRSAAGPIESLHSKSPICPVKAARTWGNIAQAPLRSSDATLGELWVARQRGEPFDDLDRDLLAGLADLAAIAVVSADLRQRDAMAAIVAERERIAREMHDSLAQVLATSHLRLRALEGRSEVRDHAALAAEIAALGDLTHEAYVDVREAILGLRESSHAERDLLGSLRIYLEKFSHQTGLAGRLETELPDDLGLAPGAEIQVIRVIQEALTNIRKHAGATRAVVRVVGDELGICLSVDDDGRGFDPKELGGREDGFGLHAMRERMNLVGGTLMIYSAPGEGTRVVARLPQAAGITAPASRPLHDDRHESYANIAG